MAEKKPPLIGVVPLVDEGRDSYWMLPGYFEGVLEAGGVPVMLPLTDDPEVLAELVSSCSGILVTGGQDVSPELYGEHGAEVAALCGELCAARDKMESILIPLAVRDDVPMLGICHLPRHSGHQRRPWRHAMAGPAQAETLRGRAPWPSSVRGTRA